MPQIDLSEQELEKVDKLVKEGLFSSRNQVIQTGLESLLQLSKEEIKRMEKVRHEVDMFLEISMGDMLYANMPAKVTIDGKEMYKVPVKSASDKTSHFFNLYVNPTTMEVDLNFLTDLRKSLPEMSDEEFEEKKKIQAEANKYCKNHLDSKLVAGIPMKDTLEVEDGFKECFIIPLIGEYGGKARICGYMYFDAMTLTLHDCSIYEKYMKI